MTETLEVAYLADTENAQNDPSSELRPVNDRDSTHSGSAAYRTLPQGHQVATRRVATRPTPE